MGVYAHKERSVGNKLREGSREKWKRKRGKKGGGGWGGSKASETIKGRQNKVWKIPNF